MYQRSISFPLKKSFFLFGPRQTGKSTLLKQRFEPATTMRYDFLRSEQYRKYSANPEALRGEVQAASQQGITHIILDEVQRVPMILDEVHSLIELKLPVSFILSGSSARKLKRTKANLLAGRAITYQLHPLTAVEIGGAFSLDQALSWGGLPPIVNEPDTALKHEIIKAYVDTYLKEEVEAEAQVRNLGTFLRFLPLAASTSGEVLNIATLARETATSNYVIQSFYEVLTDTLLGMWLQPWHRSTRRRLTRHPRFYLFDTGMLRSILGRSSIAAIPGTAEYGPLFEHFFIHQVRALTDYLRLELRFSYYRTESGAEVDLVLETPRGSILAVEIKSTEYPIPRHSNGLMSFREIEPSAHCILACRTAQAAVFPGDITALPWRLALEKIVELATTV